MDMVTPQRSHPAVVALVGHAMEPREPELGELIQEVAGRAFVAALRLLGNPDEARDALQEAAAKALDAKDSYDRSRPFYSWFHRILKNHCLDRLRERKRTSRKELDTGRVADGKSVQGAPVEAPEAAYARTERERIVAHAIATLDGDLSEMIHLRHFQELSYEEMADVANIPIGTVMSRLYRARKALRAAVIRLTGEQGRP